MNQPQSGDLIDRLLNLHPDSPTYQARHFREKARQGTQDSYDTLFSPDLSLPLASRWLIALYASALSQAQELRDHYRSQALTHGMGEKVVQAVQDGAMDGIDDAQLKAMLLFTKKLIEKPIEGDQAALLELKAAGLTTPQVIIVAQLIAFLSYQTRLVAGLKALRNAEEQS